MLGIESAMLPLLKKTTEKKKTKSSELQIATRTGTKRLWECALIAIVVATADCPCGRFMEDGDADM